MNRKYSIEMYRYLQQNASAYTTKELVITLKDKFNVDMTPKRLAQYCHDMNIKYKYEKPNKAHSNIPTENGTIVNKTDGNYLKIKTKEHKWEYLQRIIYEDYYKVKLPNDVYVIFLDQNRRNFNIDNLKAISRRSSAIMSKDELFSIEPKITKLGILNSKLKIKTKVVYDEK